CTVRRPQRPPRFPYTTLFRSEHLEEHDRRREGVAGLEDGLRERRDPLRIGDAEDGAHHHVEGDGERGVEQGERPSWPAIGLAAGDRKSTRLNSSHVAIAYAGF